MLFFFNDTATTEIYTLSLHDALPISAVDEGQERGRGDGRAEQDGRRDEVRVVGAHQGAFDGHEQRSEEHTSELQSRQYLVCRLLLEKKKKINVEHLPPLACDRYRNRS